MCSITSRWRRELKKERNRTQQTSRMRDSNQSFRTRAERQRRWGQCQLQLFTASIVLHYCMTQTIWWGCATNIENEESGEIGGMYMNTMSNQRRGRYTRRRKTMRSSGNQRKRGKEEERESVYIYTVYCVHLVRAEICVDVFVYR